MKRRKQFTSCSLKLIRNGCAISVSEGCERVCGTAKGKSAKYTLAILLFERQQKSSRKKIADVELMCDQLEYMFGLAASIQAYRTEKLDRLQNF